jgi:hypothetical protein
MNRLLLVLNVVAAGSILATNSAALLTAISPYGNRTSAAAAPVVQEARTITPVRRTASAAPAGATVTGFAEPTATRQDSLTLSTASLP